MMVLASSLGKTWCVRSSLATWCRCRGGGGLGTGPHFFHKYWEKMNESRIFRVFLIDIVINIRTNNVK